MISIVIPTYNADDTIEECLESLLIQIKKIQKKAEVLVVDDGSTDNTINIVKKYSVKLINQKHKGPAEARNNGWKKAKGDIVIFLDSDCKVGKNWLKNILKPFKDQKVAGVSVKYKTWNEDSWIARFIGYEIEQRHNRISERTNFLASYSTAYRREILKKMNGFDTSFKTASAEDNDLSYRIIQSGYYLIFLKKTYVWHKHSESLLNYFKKQFNHAVWRVFLYLKYLKIPKFIKGDEYAGMKTLIQPFLYLLLLFTIFISPYFFYLLFSVLLVIHIPAMAIPIKKNDYSVAFLIPFLFFIRGLVWLLGLVYGVLLFIGRTTDS
jgi:cellulose synthase/poly-beta-1,6-N-acetylglucosamine synthase-like glycosyltransferase